MPKKILLILSVYELNTLKTTLEEEIDRNGDEWPEVNKVCRTVLNQL